MKTTLFSLRRQERTLFGSSGEITAFSIWVPQQLGEIPMGKRVRRQVCESFGSESLYTMYGLWTWNSQPGGASSNSLQFATDRTTTLAPVANFRLRHFHPHFLLHSKTCSSPCWSVRPSVGGSLCLSTSQHGCLLSICRSICAATVSSVSVFFSSSSSETFILRPFFWQTKKCHY